MKNTPIIIITQAAVLLFAASSMAFGQTAFDKCIDSDDITKSSPVATPIEIEGRTFDRFGHMVSGALVTFEDTQGKEYSARTNQMGYYRIAGLKAGAIYHLQVAHKTQVFAASVWSFAKSNALFHLFASDVDR